MPRAFPTSKIQRSMCLSIIITAPESKHGRAHLSLWCLTKCSPCSLLDGPCYITVMAQCVALTVQPKHCSGSASHCQRLRMPYQMTHPVYISLNITFILIHVMHVWDLRLLLQPKWQAISDKLAQRQSGERCFCLPHLKKLPKKQEMRLVDKKY